MNLIKYLVKIHSTVSIAMNLIKYLVFFMIIIVQKLSSKNKSGYYQKNV